jgi:pyruvate dehydrogenase E1 component alpha subunit
MPRTSKNGAQTAGAKRRAARRELSDEQLRALYEQMVLIRVFEERAEEQYTRARIGGYLHLQIGEEATVVGAVAATTEEDYLLSSYRDHGVALARGSDPDAVMAELFGKETGVAHGRGGSMHLLDPARHFLGGWGIVGGQLPIAVGVAMALDYEQRPGGVLCMLGDGATNIGTFHESLNLAAVLRLPVLFLIENNQYGMGSAVGLVSAEPELYKRACAYRMPGERVDGMDVLAVLDATRRFMTLAREERQPGLLECMTYRFRGHSVADPGRSYRTQDEIEEWRRRDPVLAFAAALKKRGVLDDAAIQQIETQVEQRVERSVQAALAAPDPDVKTLYRHVYGPGAKEEFARMCPGAPFEEAEAFMACLDEEGG